MTLRLGLRKEKLEAVRKDLLKRRDLLAGELRQATADFIDDESTFADSVDQAAADADKTITLQIKNRDRDSLGKIDEALQRIETGVYGLCERCDEMIAEGRILAFPLTTLCIDCQAELESEDRRYPARA